MKKISGNTILITGGASGIGFGLAKRFAARGNEVIICGRRKEQLDQAQKAIPSLKTLVCDVSKEEERIRLAKTLTSSFPKLNVLLNNAGIQNRLPPLTEVQDWNSYKNEIAINIEAPIHLSMLFIPHLMAQPEAAILNVTSGLAFVPIAFMPGYCATKAAMHSFTLSLRHQLRATSISVVEVAPPAVNTDLGGKGLHDTGVPLDEYCDFAMKKLAEGSTEFGYGFSEKSRTGSREQLDGLFNMLNKS